MNKSENLAVLMRFLSLRLESSKETLSFFSELDGAVVHCNGGKNNFVYVPGKRDDRVVLVAHADTVWDELYFNENYSFLGQKFKEELTVMHKPIYTGKVIYQGGSKSWGLGADDRAGCAMLWLLRNSGHSLLITDGEEHGQIGSIHLIQNYKEIADELNDHRYMIQLDRRGNSDYKTYNLQVSYEFSYYIAMHTGFRDAGKNSHTDIVTLCRNICGVNLSIGYYNEHTTREYLSYLDWENTLSIVSRMLKGKQPCFPLNSKWET